jgi:MFS family permease
VSEFQQFARFFSIYDDSKGVRYNISNEAIIGACFLPVGLGNMSWCFFLHFKPISTDIFAFVVGAPFSGRLSDKIVVKCRKERGGEWYPEDRLRATLFSAGVMVPLSTLACGFLTAYVPGKMGLALNLICLFVSGLGVKSSTFSFVIFLHR